MLARQPNKEVPNVSYALWAGNYLLLNHPRAMQETFPEIAVMREKFPLSEPSAFWMRVRGM